MPPESSPARWAAVRAAAEAALDLSPDERAGYLTSACGGDAQLRAEVERLVRACEDAAAADGFLREPAAAFASPMLDRVTSPGDDDADGVPEALRAALDAEGYAVERELARGGMAVVYLANDRRHARPVAIKVLPRRVRAAVSAGRFLAEIRVTAGLTHPHILPLHASGEADGRLYYVMPYVDGETLRQRMTRERPLPVPVVIQLLREIAGALDYAHRQGIVHRDVKPENVLLVDGHAVVADFGIARAVSRARTDRVAGAADDAFRTQPGRMLGTPAYLAPEQARGEPATDHRVDLYALGVIAYEALAGAHPFGARTPDAMRAAHCAETPAPLATRRADVPPALAALVTRLLAKEPAARPRSAADVVRALDAVDARAPGRPRSRRIALGLWAAALAVVGALAVQRLAARGDARSAVVAAHSATRPSVAVLPFVNTGGAASDEPLSDGLTDELIATLGKVPGLDVIARTSVFALKGRRLGVRAVAETLGVATVLEGSLRRAGSRLKVTAQLVRAADGTVLWTESYDRELRDVLTMQEQIARAIAATLQVRLTGAGAARFGARAIADPVAYELFLKGRYVFNAGTGRDELLQAARFFDAAIARDPTFAPAHAGLSDVHARLSVFGYGRARDEMPRARAAALRALALDGTLAAAHVALAHTLYVHDFAPDSAERTIRRGIALDPGYVLGRTMFAIMLQFQGRFAEAHAQLDTAAALDPLASIVGTVRGRAYVNARRPDDAIRAMRAALELNPRADLAWQQLGHAYLQKGMAAEALDALRRAAALTGARDSATLAYGLAVTGNRTAARRIVAALEASTARRFVPPFELAIAHTGLGDADAAFAWIDRALTARDVFPDAVSGTIALAPLHTDARWPAMLRRYLAAR
ncbi:protein kinase domain-containing protein [Roseisolibacter agri]|uniref:non-specific serine/threonine protein kinase n=1 Tax=Roseisolibacter agri TaxID=2014610 RepID=A0AA37Q7P9_9BACT|nr:protein kinase [Roseisolibacter agri]GLC23886.1 hypothetical protein rosag_03990 [Roseisolibacter agri]